jgi:site-specific recombinase XerD
MAVIKPIVRLSDVKLDGKCNIKIRVTHKGEVLYLSTNYYIEPIHFSNGAGKVKLSHANYQKLNIELRRAVLEAEEKLLNIRGIINAVDVHYLKKYLVGKNDKPAGVYKYMERIIEDFGKRGRIKSKQSYETTLMNLKKFHHGGLIFHNIDYQFLTEFQSHMSKEGLKTNSIGVMMRNLRAAFNKAINEGIIGYDLYPFRRFKIKKEVPEKRNLPAPLIRMIATMELTPQYIMSRDIFMLSFYLMCMNLIDLYNLKKSNMIMDRISYVRSKTRQQLNMKVQPEAMEIMNKYMDKGPYLLNFNKSYKDHMILNARVNSDLDIIGKCIGITRKITLYFARHSYATIGISIGINQDVIGKSLSHASGKVTDIYTDYDPIIIDNANRKIIDHVLYSTFG